MATFYGGDQITDLIQVSGSSGTVYTVPAGKYARAILFEAVNANGTDRTYTVGSNSPVTIAGFTTNSIDTSLDGLLMVSGETITLSNSLSGGVLRFSIFEYANP